MRTTTAWISAVLAIIGAGIGIGAGIWSPEIEYGQGILAQVPCGPGWCGGLVPAPPGLSTAIVLGTTQVVAGQEFTARVVITNETDQPIALIDPHGCEPDFAAALTNANLPPQITFTLGCIGRPLVISPGVNTFRFPMLTTYRSCSMGPSGEPCTPAPIPPGTYVAVLIGSGSTPLPPAVSNSIELVSAH